jgi:hypothetical protein
MYNTQVIWSNVLFFKKIMQPDFDLKIKTIPLQTVFLSNI